MITFILYVLVLAGFYGLYRHWHTRSLVGTLVGKAGTSFSYVIGDNLKFGDRPGMFNGIDIVLPRSLPHIFLDGKTGQGLEGPRSYMLKKQIIQLEGDFNSYFTPYVIPGGEVLALSILTPDVLQTLMRAADGLDVEIYHNHLRIIFAKHILNDNQRQALGLQAATAILSEIEHKLQSWTAADDVAATEINLTMEDMPTVHILGGNIRLASILMGSIYGFMTIVVWVASIDSLLHNNLSRHDKLTVVIWSFVVLPLFTATLVIAAARGWLNRVVDFMSKH